MINEEKFDTISKNIIMGFGLLMAAVVISIFMIIVDGYKFLVFIPIISGFIGALVLWNDTFDALGHLKECVEQQQ